MQDCQILQDNPSGDKFLGIPRPT